MSEISNIDTIVELILKEARARKGPSLKVRIYKVLNDVRREVGSRLDMYNQLERNKAKVNKKAGWNKGM